MLEVKTVFSPIWVAILIEYICRRRWRKSCGFVKKKKELVKKKKGLANEGRRMIYPRTAPVVTSADRLLVLDPHITHVFTWTYSLSPYERRSLLPPKLPLLMMAGVGSGQCPSSSPTAAPTAAHLNLVPIVQHTISAGSVQGLPRFCPVRLDRQVTQNDGSLTML